MSEELSSSPFDDVLTQWTDALLRDPKIIEAADRPDFGDLVGAAVQEAIREGGANLLDELLQRAPEMLSEHLEDRTAFESRLRVTWGDALDLFEVFHVICLEAGESFFARHVPDAATTDDHVFEALSRIHARSCLVAGEVLALLRAGYPSGAHTRWRTIHELAVVAIFIQMHGSETARRYLLHDGIQAYKAALAYLAHHEKLGYEPLAEGEFEQIQRQRNALVAEFGTDFADAYGWAASALGRPARTFSAIEDAVDMSHMRALYGMASHAVHPNIHGSFFDLGLTSRRGDVLLAGPSDVGFADPGHSACVSLFQTTVFLLGYVTDVEAALAMVALQELLPRVGAAFLDAQDRQEARMAETRTGIDDETGA